MIKTIEPDSRPCCGPYALALASGNTLQYVMDIFINKVGKCPNKWKGRSYNHEFYEVLRLLVKNFAYTRSYEGRRVKTINTILDKDSIYIVQVTGHYYTYFNGWVYDQYHNNGIPVNEIKSNQLVKAIFKISK